MKRKSRKRKSGKRKSMKRKSRDALVLLFEALVHPAGCFVALRSASKDGDNWSAKRELVG
jgi:hypothetical protein